MEIILANHAERKRDPDDRRDKQIDRHQPLTLTGEGQARDVAKKLRVAGVKPTLYLTSRSLHAKQTAHIVCAELSGDPSVDVVEIDALTPFHSTESLQQIIDQAKSAGHDASLHDAIVIVGHYPRLNQLFAQLTWRIVAERRLGYGEAVHLTADSFHHLCEGKSRGQWA